MIVHLIKLHRQTRVVRRRDVDAAARGRGPAGRAAGHERLRRARRCSSRCTRSRHACSTCRRAPSGRRPRSARAVVRLEFGPPAARVSDEPAVRAAREGAVLAAAEDAARTRSSASTRRRAAVLALAGIDGRRRPETLQLTEIARLAELFASVRRARCAIVSPVFPPVFRVSPSDPFGRTPRAGIAARLRRACAGASACSPGARVRRDRSRGQLSMTSTGADRRPACWTSFRSAGSASSA